MVPQYLKHLNYKEIMNILQVLSKFNYYLADMMYIQGNSNANANPPRFGTNTN